MIRDQGRKYAVYTIHVTRTDDKGTTEIWDVFRRYSEFHDLHMTLSDKFPDLKDMPLPAKKIMKNTTKNFLDKRGKALTVYIQVCVSVEYKSHVWIKPTILSHVVWEVLSRLVSFVKLQGVPLCNGVERAHRSISWYMWHRLIGRCRYGDVSRHLCC